jgi:hypothetical protein
MKYTYYLGMCEQHKYTAFAKTLNDLAIEIGKHFSIGVENDWYIKKVFKKMILKKTKKETCRKSQAYYKLTGYKHLILIDKD